MVLKRCIIFFIRNKIFFCFWGWNMTCPRFHNAWQIYIKSVWRKCSKLPNERYLSWNPSGWPRTSDAICETPWPFHPEDKTNHLTQKCNKHKWSSAVVSNFSFWLRAGGSSREQRFTRGSYHSACCLLCYTDVFVCCVLLLLQCHMSENVRAEPIFKGLRRSLNKQSHRSCVDHLFVYNNS